jgi:MOSC domain-containing protein YiiM
MTKSCVISIHTAPARGARMQTLQSVQAVPGEGLEGDRHFGIGKKMSGDLATGRDLTLIESEAVDALNAALGAAFAASDMRRNLVTRGVALNHLVGQEFRIGAVRVRGVRLAEPCDHLESMTRPGVKAAMQHRCGLRVNILEGGTIRVGDAIAPLGDPVE